MAMKAKHMIPRELSPSEIGSTISRGASKVIKDVQTGAEQLKQQFPAAVANAEANFTKIKKFMGGE